MKTTLERIEDLEKSLSGLKATAEAMVASGLSVPKLEQDVGAIREQVGQFANAVNSALAQADQKLGSTFNYVQNLSNRNLALEQTLTSLAKMLSCVVSELQDKNVISNDSVMARLRKLDESAEKSRVTELLTANAIQEGSVISDSSILVLAQTYTKKDSEAVSIVSEYKVVDMPSPLMDEETKNTFRGKKVGDSVEDTDEEGTLKSVVTHVYDLVQSSSKEGEPTQPSSESSSEMSATSSDSQETASSAAAESAATGAA